MFSRSKLNAETIYYWMSGAMTLFDSTMFVYLTVFYFTTVGLNPLQLVLVGTVLEASILIFEVPTGVVADTYSRRLSVVLGVLTLGIAWVVTGFARTFSIVVLSQVIAGLGYTFLSGATDAWLADEVGNERVGAVYLRSGQINRLIGMLGIFISAVLASIRLDLPILMGGVMYVGLGLFLVVSMPEDHFQPFQHETGNRGLSAMLATFREGLRVIRTKPFLLNLVLIEFFVGTASEGFDRLGDAHLVANFTFPALVLPLLGTLQPILWFSIISLAGSLLSLIVVERLRPRLERLTVHLRKTARALTALTLVFAGCGIGFALAGSFPLAVTFLLLRGLAGGLIWPLYGAFRAQSIPSSVRATILSMTGQGNALGQVLGGPLVGWIGTRALRAALAISGLFILPNALLYKASDDPLVEEDQAPGKVMHEA